MENISFYNPVIHPCRERVKTRWMSGLTTNLNFSFGYRALDEVERIYEEGERARREELRHTHSIFSRIDPWLMDQLRATHDTLMEQHKWRPHEHALALCRQNDLHQHAYFLQRDLSFMREVL